ncbi:transglycosylase SLT domain-containing protein [Candidatus Giovannonibacteria bacterium]|nr:transglycosylase SLT domain-containing protein [Candidatus Giovannonibacteria bacterium]
MPKHNLNFSIDSKYARFAVFLFVFVIFLFPFITSAHIGVPDQLVPCGRAGQPPCQTCDLYILAHNIIDLLLWGIATPLLVVALIVAGAFWLTSGGSEDRVSKGRQILTSAVLGFILAFGAWIIINTILDTLAFKNPFYGGAWSDTSFCKKSPFDSTGSSTGTITDGGKTSLLIDEGAYVDGVDTSGAYFQEQPNEALSQELAMTKPGYNPQYNSQIDAKYGAMIDAAAAKYGVDPALMRAIIQAESSGNPNATHLDKDGKSSYGLSQIRPDTVKQLDKTGNAGLTDMQIGQKLFDPAYSIDMQAKYLSQLSQKYSDPVKIAAAYNGGPGANDPSRDCPGMVKWQCQWDNSAHTVPNTGYQVTRNYTTKVTSLATSLRK